MHDIAQLKGLVHYRK